MPDAVAVTLAKEVTKRLAAASLSQQFTPERSYADWDLNLEDSDLHVDVVLVTTEQKSTLAARGVLGYEVPIDIAVRKKFGLDKQDDDTGRIENASVDELMLLVQEIHELFVKWRDDDELQQVWRQTAIIVSPERKALRERRQFTGIVRVTFLAHKELS